MTYRTLTLGIRQHAVRLNAARDRKNILKNIEHLLKAKINNNYLS